MNQIVNILYLSIKSQNIYYNKIYHRIGDILVTYEESKKEKDLKFIKLLLQIGMNLNINVDFYKVKLDKLELCAKKD